VRSIIPERAIAATAIALRLVSSDGRREDPQYVCEVGPWELRVAATPIGMVA